MVRLGFATRRRVIRSATTLPSSSIPRATTWKPCIAKNEPTVGSNELPLARLSAPMPVGIEHEFSLMRVSGVQASPFLLPTAAIPMRSGSRRLPVNRLSFRMILFILVLAALHAMSMNS